MLDSLSAGSATDPVVSEDIFSQLLAEEAQIATLPEKYRARIRDQEQPMALLTRPIPSTSRPYLASTDDNCRPDPRPQPRAARSELNVTATDSSRSRTSKAVEPCSPSSDPTKIRARLGAIVHGHPKDKPPLTPAEVPSHHEE